LMLPTSGAPWAAASSTASGPVLARKVGYILWENPNLNPSKIIHHRLL